MRFAIAPLLAAAMLTTPIAAPMALAAECLNGASVDKGVVFTRKDKRTGIVTRRGDTVFIDYSTNKGYWTDERETRFGVYEIKITEFFSDEESIGGGDDVLVQTFKGKAPEPKGGTGWNTTVRKHVTSYNSSEVGFQESKRRYKVTYVYLPENNVKLSGCTYRVIPVEAAFVEADGSGFKRRWLYFPDLGFGLETKRGDDGNGLTSMKAK